MQTVTLKAYIGEDGILKIEMPTELKNTDAEVVVVVNPMVVKPAAAQGYPANFFQQIDAIEADDLLERPEQGSLSERDPLE